MTDPPRREEIDPRYAAVFQRGYDPAQHPATSPPPSAPERSVEPATGSSDPIVSPGEPASPGAAGPAALTPTRSGWRLALPVAVVSLALLIASAVLVLLPAPTEASFVLSFPALLRATLQPALALGGGVGLAVAIVVAALRIRDDGADPGDDPGAPGSESRW